ncbi:hypothetical protein ACFQH3_02685 [Haladaptatus sp. GCM10025707]|uniref:DUF7861 family protein n=1 Tax=unclassified Haladaptatus TaxID=2622732 RepID=UPI0023E75678|nr:MULTISPECIES: hypothetical protein [unclassified Haladaptatus]
MNHDRIHAKRPAHDAARFTPGTIEQLETRDDHCVVTVADESGTTHDLWVTLAVRDLFFSRLDLAEDDSPIGKTVWFRKHGGS